MNLKNALFISLLFFVFGVYSQEEPELVFSPEGGKYDGPISVELKCEEGARIYYTTDGSKPSSGSKRYRDKITVNNVSVIRAIAYVNGKRTDVVTYSYFCDREYTLPIISIATEPGNLWDFDRGIYVEGCCADTIEPYVGANYWMDWERVANIEMYETNGDLCINQIAGINLFGGFSRMLPQKSLAIFARKRYGKNRFNHQIFPDREEDKYKSFIIRNAGGDFLRAHMRDAFMTQLAAPTGVAVQAYRPAVVFLNGQYWGIQNLREKISEHYLKSNFGTDKNNVDILRHNGVARHGTSKNYKKLLAFLRNSDMSKNETIDELRGFMNIEDYIRYNIAEVYSDNRDAGGNIRYWRERTDSAKWRWVLYDLDLGLGNNNPKGYKKNTLKKFTTANNEKWPDPPWSTFIIRSLLKNKEVENQYITTFADHLNTVYHPDTAVALLDRMEANVSEEMKFHVKRWGTSYKNWRHHVSIVRHFVSVRSYYLRSFIMQKFELKDTAYVDIKFPGELKCEMRFNSLDIKRDFNGIYFQDVPVNIEVIPTHNYEFKGWKNRKETSSKLTINLKENLVLEPIIEAKPMSEWTDSLIINEFSYYQLKSDTSKDWIELYNNSLKSIDLSGWGFTKSGYNKCFHLPENTLIEPGGFVILARNKTKYSSSYSVDTVTVIGDFDFGLSKEGEHMVLYDQEGLVVDSLTYIGESNNEIDSVFVMSLVHPDSSRYLNQNWVAEAPTPGKISEAYQKYLNDEADKEYWKRIYYIGGGGFFFILVVCLLSFRYYKKRKQNKSQTD